MKVITQRYVQMAWLVRREIWEHRMVVGGPLLLAIVLVATGLISFFSPSHTMIDVNGMTPAQLLNTSDLAPIRAGALLFLGAIGLLFLSIANALQFFYSADALFAERTERTILFWKSMPVSDLETVLSKFLVAGVVMPCVALLAALITQIFLAAVVSLQFREFPEALSVFWSPWVWGNLIGLSFYMLITTMIWFAPVIGSLLLLSAWVPLSGPMRLGRSPIQLAILISVVLVIVEKLIFHTTIIYNLLIDRIGFRGYPAAALVNSSVGDIPTIGMAPMTFMTSASVWVGLLVAALTITAAVYCRRLSESRG